MTDHSSQANGFDLPQFWRWLDDLEEGVLDETQCAALAAMLEQSPAARRAYLEYFQQSAVLRMEAAKLRERGLLPFVGLAVQTQQAVRRSLLAAAALVALGAIIAALVVVTRAPVRLTAAVTADTRWSIDGVDQGTDDRTVSVVEGGTVKMRSGTLRLELESGDLMVVQGPAEVSFPSVHRPQLRHGWLWIDAQGSAGPFQIETPTLTVRDIGTRFGVRVTDDGGVETHLVSGRIEVLAGNTGKRVAELKEAGSSRAFSAHGGIEEILPAVDPFPALPKLLERPASYRTTVLGQSPVGYWMLDAAQGDQLTNQIHGSSTGMLGRGVRSGEPGMGQAGGFAGFTTADRSLYLDGSLDYAVVYALDGLHGVKRREGAVSFWIRRPANVPGRDEMLWLAGLSDEGMLWPNKAILHTVLTASGHVVFEIENQGDNVFLSSSRNIADGRWHHVVASWGPKSVDLFIDGSLAATDSKPRVMGEGSLRGRYVRFGKPSNDQFEKFHSYTGWVNELALWDRPLSPAEVDVQFQSAKESLQKSPASK